ncbi:hypothetical protein C8J57DRAFT_1225649 [Mycena rebaudengoi]|nr:hypothetical protein C8J57DRAFT_1225649 [Mycena rebaudengoi]
MSDNQESLLLPELPASSTTILVSMGWAMLDYVRYNIAHAIPGKSITFTSSSNTEIFELFLAGMHTGQLNALSARELICFNVHPTAEQTVVEGLRHPGENSEPCGIYCPARWRMTHGLRGVSHWKWGGEWGNKGFFGVLDSGALTDPSSANGVQVVLGGTRGCPAGLSIQKFAHLFQNGAAPIVLTIVCCGVCSTHYVISAIRCCDSTTGHFHDVGLLAVAVVVQMDHFLPFLSGNALVQRLLVPMVVG